ncbi:3-phenylpropionate-dihydrodiol/cinnamic acid-dihydrodiol dehydrogenase (plasmid) [Caballeronia sp. SBC1]|uniref:SDR family oxidoreductase n=1 Tax=unclassified Caballeronia TaxID=2646786 RepID=UPI0013E0F545|nr:MULTISPECIES: SDR family oxidoreductase [unclassified Caballeronia]QIE26367.1 3-phenylpropionate-dihydrodiol/cinnamic acid-dihydrodiol dehydrogenase [Caballeronia sp. SBC2]QIN64316.1 3-phenylpropionate-dihydrodiol/cinnamic acid-dihydrodiol dehydrogenase [Caballeronia sp. SBC1]
MRGNGSIVPDNRRQRVVLVTGASGGLGKATVDHFHSRGWSVAAAARDPRNLHLWRSDGDVFGVRLDLLDQASVKAAVAEVEERFGHIDVLVNNAGTGLAGPLEAMEIPTLQKHFETNVMGAISVTKAVLPGMRRKRTGTIVNVTSIAGRLGLPFMAPYVAAKFALEGLAESLRYELAPFGIKMRLVEPSGIRTSFQHEWISDAPYEREIAMLRQHMADGMAKSLLPEKVASVIYRAAVSTGSTLRFPTRDAGLLMLIKSLLPDSILQALIRVAFLKEYPTGYEDHG